MSTFPPSPEQRRVHFSSADGLQLEGMLAEGQGAWGAVVCHPHPMHGGNMNNKVVDAALRTVVEAGGHALRFNFRGVEGSEGEYGEGIDEAKDLQGAIEFLRQNTSTAQPLWLLGYSFGTRVISYLLEAQPELADGVLFIAPPLGHLNVQPIEPPPLGLHCVLGDDDQFCTPFQLEIYTRELEASRVHTQIIEKCDHFFHGKLPQLVTWLRGALVWDSF